MSVVKVGDLEFCYDEFGNKSDPVIVLVVGLGGQMVLYHQDFCQGLANKGFRVIRFDNRDIGLSSKITDKKTPNFKLFFLLATLFGYAMKTPYVLKDMADDVVGILDALNIEKAHIVGVSMGGMILQQCLIHHGERFLSGAAIMTSSLNRKLPKGDATILRALTAPISNPADKNEVMERSLRIYTMLSGPKYPIDDKTKETLTLAVERSVYPQGVIRQMMAILATQCMSPQLKHVQHPVVVIHGSDDKLVRVEAGKDIHANLPNSTLEVIPGMGHTLPHALFPKFIELITNNAAKA